MKALRIFLISILLCGASVSPAASAPALVSVPAGDCSLSLEAAENWPALRLRASHPEHRPCAVDPAAVREALTRAFSGTHPAMAGRQFTSLAIGRLIDYPWLVRFLVLHAAQDSEWDADAGKPRRLHANRYVAEVLSSQEITGEIEPPLRAQGYRITGVSAEKVLVGGFENVPQLEGPWRKGKIPFDAQVWFRMERF